MRVVLAESPIRGTRSTGIGRGDQLCHPGEKGLVPWSRGRESVKGGAKGSKELLKGLSSIGGYTATGCNPVIPSTPQSV